MTRVHPRAVSLIALGMVVAAALFVFVSRAVLSQSTSDLKQSIETEITKLEGEIAAYNQEIIRLEGQVLTLNREIGLLDAEIKKAEAEIRLLTLSIGRLTRDISTKEEEISETNGKISEKKKRIGSTLQVLSEQETASIVEMLLSNDSISEFFDTLADLEALTEGLRQDLQELVNLKGELTQVKEELEEKRVEESKLRAAAEISRQALSTNRTRRSRLLAQTRGQETRFQQLVSQSANRIAELREQLQALERAGIPVTEAVEVAKFVAAKVGIRPAFLLAVLEYESRLGQNVGTGSWRTDMKPCRTSTGEYCGQQAAFLEITRKLGLDPDKTLVSRKPYYGWGGAMGPAQFIPLTWLLYADAIAAVTGHNPPSPWNTQDAFTAAALKLARDGASARTPAGEGRAAKAYVSGSPSCRQYICNKYSRDVLAIAARIERNLDQVASR